MLSNWEEKAALDKWTTMGIPRDRDHYLHPDNLEGLQDGAAVAKMARDQFKCKIGRPICWLYFILCYFRQIIYHYLLLLAFDLAFGL